LENLSHIRKLRMTIIRLAFVPLVFIALFVWPSWKADSIPDMMCEWGGYLLILVGLAIRIWSTMYIGQRKSKELITEGPFSMSRNPLYVGSFIVIIGIAFSLVNYVLLLAALFITVPLHFIVVLSEEENLQQLFGRQYEDYRRNVPRFWFRISRFHTTEYITVSPRSIYRITAESGMVLMIPVIEDIIELLHDKNILPVLWHI
jgi:protein-S-isoprenylcysteine O-methyltransferase Ste14